MTYEIRWDKKAHEYLLSLTKEDVVRIVKKLDQAKLLPEHYFESLENVEARKLRVGDYRLIADIDNTNKIIYIRFVGHRKNIYDIF